MDSRYTNQPNAKPTRKVTAYAAAGTGAALLIWILSLFHITMPPEAAAEAVTIIGAIVAYIIKERAP